MSGYVGTEKIFNLRMSLLSPRIRPTLREPNLKRRENKGVLPPPPLFFLDL